VDVEVADAAILDVDEHILGRRLAPLDGVSLEGSGGSLHSSGLGFS
jgi:hypothetical protein